MSIDFFWPSLHYYNNNDNNTFHGNSLVLFENFRATYEVVF